MGWVLSFEAQTVYFESASTLTSLKVWNFKVSWKLPFRLAQLSWCSHWQETREWSSSCAVRLSVRWMDLCPDESEFEISPTAFSRSRSHTWNRKQPRISLPSKVLGILMYDLNVYLCSSEGVFRNIENTPRTFHFNRSRFGCTSQESSSSSTRISIHLPLSTFFNTPSFQVTVRSCFNSLTCCVRCSSSKSQASVKSFRYDSSHSVQQLWRWHYPHPSLSSSLASLSSVLKLSFGWNDFVLSSSSSSSTFLLPPRTCLLPPPMLLFFSFGASLTSSRRFHIRTTLRCHFIIVCKHVMVIRKTFRTRKWALWTAVSVEIHSELHSVLHFLFPLVPSSM